MGYTHYWRRVKTFDKAAFNRVVEDFKKLLPSLEAAGVKLAGPLGTGEPEIAGSKIAFNGSVNCGHPAGYDLAIPWPSPDAGGVFAENPVAGTWLAGHLVNTRTCPGDCSYESFVLERAYVPLAEWDQPDGGYWFNFCKTAFRPYDLAVTAVLVIAKHRLGDAIQVSSDGEDAHWFDARLLCQMELGYGLEYIFNADGALIAKAPRHCRSMTPLLRRGGL